jgi:hypothetical protein
MCSSAHNSAPTGRIFMKFGIGEFFRNFVHKIQVWFQSDKNNEYLHKDQYKLLIIFRSVLLRMRNVSDESCKKINTNILCSVTFSRKWYSLRDNVEICSSQPGHRWQYNMTTAHCMPDNYGHERTLSEYVIIIAFSTTTMVERTCLSNTLHVRCLSCCVCFAHAT